jgi:hypothetical protein
MIESDIILTMARHARKDFPRMGANKLRVYLRPKLEQTGLHSYKRLYIMTHNKDKQRLIACLRFCDKVMMW